MIPRLSDRLFKSWKQKVNKVSYIDQAKHCDRSINGFKQFSPDSSILPLMGQCSLNHNLPPVCLRPSLANFSCQAALVLL